MASAPTLAGEERTALAVRLSRSATALVSSVLLALALAACSTQQARLQEADRLAKAGKLFSENLPILYDSFFETAVEVDSLDLARQREVAIRLVEGTDPAARPAAAETQRDELAKQLDQTNEEITRQLRAVRAAKRHAEALRSYFIGLEAFTAGDAEVQTGEAIKGLVGRVVSFSDGLKDAAANSPLNLDSVATVAGEYIVLGVKSAKLSAHLEEHGQSVHEALGLQAAFVEAVGRNMENDLRNKALVTMKNPLYADYQKLSGALPSDWWRRRMTLLEHEVGVAALDDARRAAQTLLQSWGQLAEGQLSGFTLETLIADVETVIAVVQKLRADREAEQ